MPNPDDCNLWSSTEHALEYLRRADSIPHRTEGEATLLEFVPLDAARILDVGSGGGRLLSLVKADRPQTAFVALDFSPAMLEELHGRFDGDGKVTIVAHDFSNPLPPLGEFDSVISSFAIHHVLHERKRSLYREVFDLLRPGGAFCNLEHVGSPTDRLHQQFLDRIETKRRRGGSFQQTARYRSAIRLAARKSALWTWTATGSGASWRCSAGSKRMHELGVGPAPVQICQTSEEWREPVLWVRATLAPVRIRLAHTQLLCIGVLSNV